VRPAAVLFTPFLSRIQLPQAFFPANEASFSPVITGPLSAAVKAQALAAQSSIHFIKQAGFNPDGSVTTVSLSFKGFNSTTQQYIDRTMTIPLLAILPIPFVEVCVSRCATVSKRVGRASFVQVEELTISFNAKITSVRESVSEGLVEAGANVYIRSAAFTAGITNTKKTMSSSKEQREFSLKVFVKAGQPPMPAGMNRIIGFLEDGILNNPPSA
jgi:hypothetical protein